MAQYRAIFKNANIAMVAAIAAAALAAGQAQAAPAAQTDLNNANLTTALTEAADGVGKKRCKSSMMTVII